MNYEEIYTEAFSVAGMPNDLIGEIVSKVLLVVWPPQGESSYGSIDCSLGLVMASNEDVLYVVKASRIHSEQFIHMRMKIGPVFSSDDFEERIKGWMECLLDEVFSYEVFDMSRHSAFSGFIGNKLVAIEPMRSLQFGDVIGHRFVINSNNIDLILNGDGTTVFTAKFNEGAKILINT